MGDTFHIFGYGSLIPEPERPGAVEDRQWGRLRDYRRCFNKRSVVRGCPRRDAYDVFGDAPGGFRQPGWVCSLAVGTEPSPGRSIVGAVLTYACVDEAEVLAVTDAREGYCAQADAARMGYVRARVSLERLGGSGEPIGAWTYLSNPGGDYHAPDSLDLQTRARILVDATPRPDTPSASDPKARGLDYLEQIRAGLWRQGVVDPELEALAHAARELAGPWSERLAAPRRGS